MTVVNGASLRVSVHMCVVAVLDVSVQGVECSDRLKQLRGILTVNK